MCAREGPTIAMAREASSLPMKPRARAYEQRLSWLPRAFTPGTIHRGQEAGLRIGKACALIASRVR